MKNGYNQTCLNLTATEMIDALHNPWQETEEGYRRRSIRKDVVISWSPFRFVPLDVLELAEKLLYNPVKACEYIVSAFYAYREIGRVERELYIPHIFKNGAFEWPNPVDFDWTDADQLLCGREVFYKEPENLELHIKGKKYEHIKKIDVKTGKETISLRKLGDADRMKDGVKYYVPDVQRIGLLCENLWQNESLSKYVIPLSEISDILRKKKVYVENTNLRKVLRNLRESTRVPSMYLSQERREFEEDRTDFLTWLHWG